MTKLAGLISSVILLSAACMSRGQENPLVGDKVKQNGDITLSSKDKPSSDCVIRLDFAEKKVDSSEPIVLLIEFENLSGRTILLTISDIETIFDIKVEDANSKVMPLTRYGQRKIQGDNVSDQFMRSIQNVKPGEKKDFKILLNRMYDMSIPGEYSVNAKKTFYFVKDQKTDRKTIDAISNTAKVNVGGFNGSEKPNLKPTKEE